MLSESTLMLWYLVQQHVAAFYHIPPEKPISLSMEACTHERRPLRDNAMIVFPETVRFCGSFYTSKRQNDYNRDSKRVASLQSTVQIRWHEVNDRNICELEYKGYQQQYRISPDLGYYIECQKAISQYISQLAIRKTPTWDIGSNEKCPLRKLPRNYEGYLACDFVRGKWYEMSFKSVIRYEIFYKKIYRTFWSNHSSTFLIRPDFLIKSNDTEVEWLSKLISLKIRSLNCDDAEFLINLDSNWSQPISLLIRYRIRLNTHVHYVNLIANRTVQRWMTGTFVLIPSQAVHELCYEVSWEPYEYHLQQCVPFHIEEKCFESNGAQLPVKSSTLALLLVAAVISNRTSHTDLIFWIVAASRNHSRTA